MDEIKEIIRKISDLKLRINSDLIEVSKHFEKLGKIVKTKNSTAYLRCKGHMRIASAMIRGVDNLRLNLIVPEEEIDLTTEESDLDEEVEEVSEE